MKITTSIIIAEKIIYILYVVLHKRLIIPARTHVARKRNVIGDYWLSSYVAA